MPPAVKTILGAILLLLGVVDLLKFGLKVLMDSPLMIIGIIFTVAGAALLTSGRKSLP